MKARDVYLEAARLVAEERGPACCRIDQAAGRKGAGYSRHAMRFQELFQPTDAEIQEHEVAYPFWLRLRSESYMSKVAQHRRVMALCFMAAII